VELNHKEFIILLKSLINESSCSGEVTDANITIQSAKFKKKSIIKKSVNRLLGTAVPSPFGRGNETVFDDKVRKGKELSAEHIQVSSPQSKSLYKAVRDELFYGKKLAFKFYKLAFYECGGKAGIYLLSFNIPSSLRSFRQSS